MTDDTAGGETTIAPDDVVRAMVDRHGGAVYRLAVSIVRDPALAEDVAQETFIRAWQNWHTYRADAPVRHWLLRIAHNVGVSTLRTLREEARDPQSLPGHHTAGADSTVETRIAVDEALSRLDELSRSIVVLRELEGLTYAEISDTLGVPLPTVKTRLFRARAALRETTEDNEP